MQKKKIIVLCSRDPSIEEIQRKLQYSRKSLQKVHRDENFGVWVLYSLLFIGESIFDFDRILILNIKRHFWTFHERDILDPESELVRIISLRERSPQSGEKK